MTSQNKTDTAQIDELLEGHFYKLDGKTPVPCSFEEYVKTTKLAKNRIIEQTSVGNILVSTIFTGLDRSFGQGEKKLFETSVFGLPLDWTPCYYFATYNQAVKVHRKLVSQIKDDNGASLIEQVKQAAHENARH